jgi:hypothetical protein
MFLYSQSSIGPLTSESAPRELAGIVLSWIELHNFSKYEFWCNYERKWRTIEWIRVLRPSCRHFFHFSRLCSNVFFLFYSCSTFIIMTIYMGNARVCFGVFTVIHFFPSFTCIVSCRYVVFKIFDLIPLLSITRSHQQITHSSSGLFMKCLTKSMYFFLA